MASQLRTEACVYTHVPYEIDGFDEIVADPQHTITFNHSLHQLLMSRARQLGADGKLLTDDRGETAGPAVGQAQQLRARWWHLAQHAAT